LLVILGITILSTEARCADPLKPSTELGITVTPQQVFNSMTEMAAYWPAVRNYVESEKFTAADLATRKLAVERLKQLDARMSARLDSEEEAVGLDFLEYLAARVRKTEAFRQLREAIDNDLAMFRLKTHWDTALAPLERLDDPERSTQIVKLAASMKPRMEVEGLPQQTIARAAPLWEVLAKATVRVDATAAGLAVVQFESEVESAAKPVARLTFSLIEATEWALMTKAANQTITRQDFIAAWEALARFRQPQASSNRG
jgi:hypothetical protein